MRFWSLKWQIVLLVLAVVVIILLSLTTLTISQIREHMHRGLESEAVSVSALLASNLGPVLAGRDSSFVAEIATTAFSDDDIVGIGVYDAADHRIFQSAAEPDVFPRTDSCNHARTVEITHRDQLCYVERPILKGGIIVGCLWLVISEEQMNAQLYRSGSTVIVVALVLLLLSTVAVAVLSRRMLKPIRTFERAATRISSGDMNSAVDLKILHQDFVPLGASFNNMQSALSQAFQELKKSRHELESQVAERTQALRDELSERKRTEAELRVGRELLKATLESTADGILVVDSAGTATHANERFGDMWRIPPDLMATRDDDSLLAHVLDQLRDPDAFLAKVRQLYDSRDESFDILYFKDGRVFERFSCPLIQDGSLAGRVWSFRDVSERVHAIQRLQFTQFSLDHAAEPAYWIREDARLFYVNETACRELGYTHEQLLTMAIHDIDPNLPPEAWVAHWNEVKTKGSLTFQSTHRNQAGHEYPVEITASYVEFGGEAYRCTFARDITERRRAEQAQAVLLKVAEAANQHNTLEDLLKIVQQQLGTLIDTKNFYVALWNADEHQYTFPYSRDEHDDDCSPQRLEGSLTDYVRRNSAPLLVDDRKHRELVSRNEAHMIGHPSAIWMGVPLRTASGTIGVMVAQNYHNPEAYGQADLDWMMSIAEPIARVIERTKAEEERRQLSEELERAERMKSLGILAGGVAHDLNNMLGPLVGYPELMLLKIPEDSPIRKQVLRIGLAARQAADVVQDLLTLARRGRYEMVPTDLNAVIEGYLDSPGFAKLSEKRADVQVSTNLDRNVSTTLGSTPHLSKVIMNLVVNAFDAMPNGGTLTISTEQQYLEKLQGGYDHILAGNYTLVTVRDSGTGIDPTDIDKIFEPYYSKKKMGTSGSGLGLSVVYGVVKDHKGYYDVFSEVGKGTAFVLYFPISEVVAEQRYQTMLDLKGTETVLVVDDDISQREMAAELLASYGYRVSCAATGHEALEVLKTRTVDIIVLDMIMERDFDGLDAYREIIKLRPGQPVIVVSGFSPTERVEEMQKMGAGEYVRKPYTRQSLATALRTELNRSSGVERTEVQAAPGPK